MKTKIKTIDINCLEWFDKLNGNSYFAGTVTINFGMKNEKRLNIPFNYGYGSQYIQEAKEILQKNKNINPDKFTELWKYCQDNDIVLRTSLKENCKKRELMQF
jgi:hypothetical protein